jgi:uncharacterized membrane protein
MEKFNYRREIILLVFVLLPIIYLAYVWNSLPDTVPIHFGVDGEPNGWGRKAMEFVLIGANAFVYLLTLFIRYIDPKNLNDSFFTNNFYKLRTSLTVFLSVTSILVIHSALPGTGHATMHWIAPCVFLFVSLAGNFMINLKPNWILGIRTPWTLSSDTVWRKTHQIGGRIFFYGGLICIPLSFLIHGLWLNALIAILTIGATVFLFAYSFWVFKQEQSKTN